MLSHEALELGIVDTIANVGKRALGAAKKHAPIIGNRLQQAMPAKVQAFTQRATAAGQQAFGKVKQAAGVAKDSFMRGVNKQGTGSAYEHSPIVKAGFNGQRKPSFAYRAGQATGHFGRATKAAYQGMKNPNGAFHKAIGPATGPNRTTLGQAWKHRGAIGAGIGIGAGVSALRAKSQNKPPNQVL